MNKFVRSLIGISRTYGWLKASRRGICILAQKIVGPPYDETVVTTTTGAKMFLIPRDKGISTELRVFKTHEPIVTKILEKEIKSGATVFDIGSNIGYYAILESKLVGQNGTVIAVEPIKRNFEYLNRNIKLNNLSNIKTIRAALSDKEGYVDMISHTYSNWSRVIANEEDVCFNTEKVVAITGDKLSESFQNIGLLRMDVEGYEDYVINGCNKLIEKWSPDILIEVHSGILGRERVLGLMDKFLKYNYSVKYFIPRDLDFPLVADFQDVKQLGIKEIGSKSLSAYNLFLKHNSENR